MFVIQANEYYLSAVLKSMSICGFPQYKHEYTKDINQATTFASRDSIESFIDEHEPHDVNWYIKTIG